MKWLIWSIEHNGWWKPMSLGYTREITEAGQFSLEEAIEIVTEANRNQRTPDEAMVPASVINELPHNRRRV